MKNLSKLLTLLCLVPSLSFAQNNVQDYIDNKLKTDSLFIGSAVGILAVDANGKEVASWNPDMALLTASTMKTITTGVAMQVLGPDYRFETSIGYDVKVTDGVLRGKVYIIGGADPTLGSRDTIAYPIDSIFGVWAKALNEEGIYKVTGKIIGDDRFFENEMIPDTWVWGDLGADYGSGTSGLSFGENLVRFTIAPGAKVGDPAIITPVGEHAPEMKYLTEVTTGGKGTGDKTWYYTSDLAPIAKITGSYAIDRKADTLVFSNKYSASTVAAAFSNYLINNNRANNGSISVEGLVDGGWPVADVNDITLVTTTYSPELIKIIEVTNRISNNFFAETMLKMIGKTLKDEGSYKASFEGVKEFLKGKGCSTTGLKQDDGSGLSRENYVSTRFFCNFYEMMQKYEHFPNYLNSFPVPGHPGTLKSVLRNCDTALKEKIHAKSGSLSNVRCYAGYVEGKSGLIRFAILVNNFNGPTSGVQPKIEGFMKELATYGKTH